MTPYDDSLRRYTSDTTELARARNRQAADRTLTSWIQNCLGLIGFGATFHSIFDAVNQSFPQNSPEINRQITYVVGLSAIGLGIFLLLPVTIEYRRYIRLLAQEDFLARPPRLFNLRLLVGAMSLYGLIALIAVFVVRSWG